MPASSKIGIELSSLIGGYRLCAQTEGKSKKTIQTVADSVSYLERFLRSEGLTIDVTEIGPGEIRAFILHLQQKRCFSDHPFVRSQERGLSRHTISCYLRSIRAFWSWLISEGVVEETPFARVKIPKAPRKVIPTFSDSQIRALLDAIDNATPEGFRDYVIILALLDTALRVTELTGLRLDNLWLEEGVLKVMGKGGKERLVPIGKGLQRLLWKYINRFRPEPAKPNCDFLFLTADGRPITRNRIQKRMALYGERAGLRRVRCSPHTLRHTAAVSFLRNGGDVFSLQRLLGHTSLEMTRHYCELADVDVKRAHTTASPVDNLRLLGTGHKGARASPRARGGSLDSLAFLRA